MLNAGRTLAAKYAEARYLRGLGSISQESPPIIVLWNTLYMTAAVERLKQHGYPVLEEDLARLSPLIYEHINMLGRYSFAVPEEVARGELRPLRNPDDDL